MIKRIRDMFELDPDTGNYYIRFGVQQCVTEEVLESLFEWDRKTLIERILNDMIWDIEQEKKRLDILDW